MYKLVFLALLIQGCAVSQKQLTETDCSVLYRKGWFEFQNDKEIKAELISTFSVIESEKNNSRSVTKWFQKSETEVAICESIPNNDSCGSTYMFFSKDGNSWTRGDDIITICG